MKPKTIIALTGLVSAIAIGWLFGDPAAGAEPEDLEVLTESAEVQVLANEDRTYAEYEYTEPLAGTVIEKVYRGERTAEGCEYSGSMSGSTKENRVWVQREISTDTETCKMTMEGAWITEAEATTINAETTADDPDWQHDGWIKGKTTFYGAVHTWTKSRVRWNDTTCVTSYLRTSAWWWLAGALGWERVAHWTSGTSPSCGTAGLAWASIGRTTFAEYEGDPCPDGAPIGGPPPLETSHQVTFTGKVNAWTAAWTLKEWGDPFCTVFASVTHTVDPG